MAKRNEYKTTIAMENNNAGMSKPTTSGQVKQKLYGLDHLRALAIILVFVYHYGRLFPHPEWTNTISEFGWTGVDLFFVLSGYLIASQLFASVETRGKILLKEFFIKRSFRILPAYLFVVALYFLFPLLREQKVLPPLWKYLTFTQNIKFDFRYGRAFSHAWSLCVEEQFYLLFPFLLTGLLYYKIVAKGFLLLLLFFLSGFAIRLYSWHVLISPYRETDLFGIYWYKWMYYPTWCRLDGLLAGVSIAAIFQFKPALKTWMQKHAKAFLAVGLLVLTAAYFLCSDQETLGASLFGFPLVDIGYGLVVTGAISPATFLYKTSLRWTTKIAAWSYAIYLTHKIIIHQTQVQFAKLGIEKESNVMFLICILTCLLGAILMNKLIELPFLAWRERWLKKMRAGNVYNIGVTQA